MLASTYLLRRTWGCLLALLLAGAAHGQAPGASVPQLIFDSGDALYSSPEKTWFSADNQLLALADDQEIRVYDTATGLLIKQLHEERNYARIQLSADFRRLRYVRLPQTDESAGEAAGHEVVRGVLNDSVFFRWPITAQDGRYCKPLAAGRLAVDDGRRLRLQGPRPADTLTLAASTWASSRDGRWLLTQRGNAFRLVNVLTHATRELRLAQVPRRWQTAAEQATARPNCWNSYRAGSFTLTPDGRRLYGSLEAYQGEEKVFRIFDVATDSVVFSQAYRPGSTASEAYYYHPAYYPSCQVVTLPQQTDLVVHNLKTGTTTRLPYPGYRFGLASQVTADGRAVVLWTSEFVDVYDLQAGRYVWRAKAHGPVRLHPQAALLYIGTASKPLTPDSTILLRFAPALTVRRVPGTLLQSSPDGTLAYGQLAYSYALFDENMTLLRPLNACSPTASVQPTTNPAVLLTGELGTCRSLNETASRLPDFQVWNLQRMERRPVQLPADRVAELATFDGLSPFEDDLVYNELGRPRLLTDSARLTNVCRTCGRLQALDGAYSLFHKEASLASLLDASAPPERDTLTLVVGFRQKQVVLAAPRQVKLAALNAARREICALTCSPDASTAAYFTTWDFAGQKLRERPVALPREFDPVSSSGRLDLSPGGRFAFITSADYVPGGQPPPRWAFDLTTGRCLNPETAATERFLLHEPAGRVLSFTDSAAALATTYVVRQAGDWKKLRTFRCSPVSVRQGLLLGFWAVTAPGTNGKPPFLPTGPSRLALLDWGTGATLYQQTILNDRITAGDISPDGQWLAYADIANRLHLVSVASQQEVAQLPGHTKAVLTLRFTADNRRLISSAADGTVRVWSVAQRAEIGSLVTLGPENYLASTPAGYYRCSKGALGRFGYRLGEHAYAAEQFDLRYNRPDKVLAAFGADSAQVQGYRAAWRKRVQRAGFSARQLAGTAPVPTLTLLNRAALPYATTQPSVSCELLLTDSLALLDRLNVWVNGVAVYGKRGLPQRASPAHRLRLTVPVALGAGPNRVEFSAQNAQGVESYRTTFIVNRTSPPAAPGQVYFVGIGVSRFADARYNLRYAAKDIRDMARAVRRRYPTAHIDTLLDAQVTRASVRALKKKLLATGLEDRVLLSVAGHGLLDRQLAFYYATHDMDFADPARRGVLYDDLEGLLDSIPARRRLLLLDACHSGEVDRDLAPAGAAAAPATAPAGPVRPVFVSTARGAIDASAPAVGLQNSFALMQDLFADLSRGTGTQVIAAAAGNSYAYELPTLRNGVFTHCVLDYLTHQPKGSIRVNALRESVAAQVSALTHGAQKPSARAANNEFDWELW